MSVQAVATVAEEPEARQQQLVNAGFFDQQSFQLMQRIAKGFSASTLVPKIYQGGTPEAIGNCMIALNLARRIGADPLMVMQNLNIVQSRPTWSSQFLIACVNTCGRFSAMRFEFFGIKGTPGWGCRAWAVEKSTGDKLVGSDITMELAQKEGWVGRSGSKWGTMPQQMFIYRSGAWWTKAYAPELSMGLLTSDEAQDMAPREEVRSFMAVDGAQPQDQPEPPTIASRLDAFAAGEEPYDQTTGEIPDPAAAAGGNLAPAAQAEAAPSSPPVNDGAASQQEPKAGDAWQRGYSARESGMQRELPRDYRYKNRAAEAEAFLRGFDHANDIAQAEEAGSQ